MRKNTQKNNLIDGARNYSSLPTEGSDLSENQRLANSIVNDMVENFESGKLSDDFSENVIEFVRDSGGKVTRVVFAVGGPYIYLDVYCHPGQVVVEWGLTKEDGKAFLPVFIIDDILDVIAEFDYER